MASLCSRSRWEFASIREPFTSAPNSTLGLVLTSLIKFTPQNQLILIVLCISIVTYISFVPLIWQVWCLVDRVTSEDVVSSKRSSKRSNKLSSTLSRTKGEFQSRETQSSIFSRVCTLHLSKSLKVPIHMHLRLSHTFEESHLCVDASRVTPETRTVHSI